MPYIFLDESGQFTKYHDDKYFVVGTFTTGDYRRTAKRFRAWQRERFPRKLRYQPEIKFSDIHIDEQLRLRTLKFIADLDIRIHYTFLLRGNIPNEYRSKKGIKSGHLYTEIVAKTLELYIPPNDLEFRVFCDRRHLKGIKRSQFKERLKIHL